MGGYHRPVCVETVVGGVGPTTTTGLCQTNDHGVVTGQEDMLKE